MATKPFFKISRPFREDRPIGGSSTIPQQGYTPGEWVKRIQSGLALPTEHSAAECVTDVDAQLRRLDLDINRRRELIAQHKIKFSRPPAPSDSVVDPKETKEAVPPATDNT